MGKVQPERKDEDVFTTHYRCNTKHSVGRMLQRHGFDHHVYSYEPEPGYLSFSRVLYPLGVVYQRLVPELCKTVLFAFGRRGVSGYGRPTDAPVSHEC